MILPGLGPHLSRREPHDRALVQLQPKPREPPAERRTRAPLPNAQARRVHHLQRAGSGERGAEHVALPEALRKSYAGARRVLCAPEPRGADRALRARLTGGIVRRVASGPLENVSPRGCGECPCPGENDPLLRGSTRGRDETCPVSTEGGTRRVQLVQEGGWRGGGAFWASARRAEGLKLQREQPWGARDEACPISTG